MDEMKRCPRCGTMVSGNAKYCGECQFRFLNVMDVQQLVREKLQSDEEAQPLRRERGRGGFYALLAAIAVVVVAAAVLVTGASLGWFHKEEKAIELAETEVTVEAGEHYDIVVTNYDGMDEARLHWTSGDEDVVTVKARRDGSAQLTAQEDGEVYVTVEAEGYTAGVVHVHVLPPYVPAALVGTALETENGTYYFLDGAQTYYFISEDTENYIKGSVTVREAAMEDLAATEAAGMAGLIEDADYYRVDAVVEQELYFGSQRSGNQYTMYVATNGQDAAIYDSGWGNYYTASVVGNAPESTLQAFFPQSADTISMTGVGGASSTTALTGGYTVDAVHFGEAQGRDDSWYIVDAGNYYVYKQGARSTNELYAMPKDQLGSAAPTLLLDVGADHIVTVMAADGDQLYYGVGRQTDTGYEPESLYEYDFTTGASTLLASDEVEDICVTEDYVYYTDYAKLVCIDRRQHTAVTVWDYGVYCYEPVEDMLLVYDGEAWELIDGADGAEYGYVIDGINYAYECDVARYEAGVIFHVAYDYVTEEVSLRAVDVEEGKEYQIGDAYWGTKSDTYNVFYDANYVYYTVDEWETLVRVDVATGETLTRSMADEGYYYVNEFVWLDGKMAIRAYDRQHNSYYLRMDREMRLTRIEGLDG